MSSFYRLHPGTRMALLQGEGPLSLTEWGSAAREVLGLDSWRGTRRILSDRRRMPGSFPPGMEETVLTFFREHAVELGEVQWAVVVPEDSVAAFATIRLAAELSKGTRVRVQGFTDIVVALHWLLGAYDDEQIAALMRWIDDKE